MLNLAPIVLTNDDGFEAEGMLALARALEARTGEAPHIVAPNRCYSGASQQVTMSTPIPVEQRGLRSWVVGGAPADCARLAITHFVPECRLVLSGINHGGNMGHDTYVSGTVGAAREAALLGINAAAISHYFRPGLAVNWDRAASWAVAALESIALVEGGDAHLWNINLPHLDSAENGVPPIVRCTPCSRPLPIAYTQEGNVYHYDGGRYHARGQDPGTDVEACFSGNIAVSPLPVRFPSL